MQIEECLGRSRGRRGGMRVEGTGGQEGWARLNAAGRGQRGREAIISWCTPCTMDALKSA